MNIKAVLIFAALFVVSTGFVSAIDIYDCQTLDVEGMTYVLQNDISDISQSCFKIRANNVTIDLNGYILSGIHLSNNHGVFSNGFNSAIVRNGKILNFDSGVRLENSDYNLVKELTLTNSTSGVSIWLGNNNIIENNNLVDNFATGVYISSSSNNRIHNNNVTGNNLDGISISRSTDISIDSNSLRDTTNGIELMNSDNIFVTDNIISQNRHSGIYTENSDNNLILNNKINFNDEGIHMENSSTNKIHENMLDSNEEWGVYIEEGDHNIISDSEITNTYEDGIYFDETSNNEIFNTKILNSGNNDFYIEADKDKQCSHKLKKIEWTKNKETLFYNEKSEIGNKDVGSLILCNADNSTIKDIKINPEEEFGGLFIIRTDDLAISDISISNTDRSILLIQSDNNIIKNCNSSYNDYPGIVFSESDNNRVENCVFESNDDGGIAISDYSKNNIIENSNIINNYEQGIYIEQAKNNILRGNNIQNEFGIYLGQYAEFNTFYNNIINNAVNIIFEQEKNHSWNVKAQKGENVIGGQFIGGNYWANPEGTGFSETCLDDNVDGFCDMAYEIANNNIDFLPLTMPREIAECKDGIDNDKDGLIDYPADPSCDSYFDDSEEPYNYPQCRDAIDNDGDGFIDFPEDPECSTYWDNDEKN